MFHGKQSNYVDFIVEYEDGRKARIAIDRHTLKMGDNVAPSIAAERQQNGDLPPGKIIGVRRS